MKAKRALPEIPSSALGCLHVGNHKPNVGTGTVEGIGARVDDFYNLYTEPAPVNARMHTVFCWRIHRLPFRGFEDGSALQLQ
jgi:hypothetical protein